MLSHASTRHCGAAPAPFDVLRTYLAERASFSDDEFETIRRAFVPRSLRAGAFLQRAGDVTRHAAFVARGCLRNYVIDDKGKEHIVQFAPETWWLADSESLDVVGNHPLEIVLGVGAGHTHEGARTKGHSRFGSLGNHRSQCRDGDSPRILIAHELW